MDLGQWFLSLSPEGQTFVTVVGVFAMRELIPFFWRWMNRQQDMTSKALDNANDTSSTNQQLVKLLSDNLATMSKTLESLERLASRHQDILQRVDETTQNTRKELQASNFTERLRHIEATQMQHSRILVKIFTQAGGIIPKKEAL